MTGNKGKAAKDKSTVCLKEHLQGTQLPVCTVKERSVGSGKNHYSYEPVAAPSDRPAPQPTPEYAAVVPSHPDVLFGRG